MGISLINMVNLMGAITIEKHESCLRHIPKWNTTNLELGFWKVGGFFLNSNVFYNGTHITNSVL